MENQNVDSSNVLEVAGQTREWGCVIARELPFTFGKSKGRGIGLQVRTKDGNNGWLVKPEFVLEPLENVYYELYYIWYACYADDEDATLDKTTDFSFASAEKFAKFFPPKEELTLLNFDNLTDESRAFVEWHEMTEGYFFDEDCIWKPYN